MSTEFKVENGFLIAVSTDCRCSTQEPPGTVCTEEPCRSCGGNGKTKGGKGKGTCRTCNGFKKHYNHDVRQVCPECQGNWQAFYKPGDMYADVPKEIWQGLDFRVIRQKRAFSFNETMLAFGCVYSCNDYGSAWAANDDEGIIKHVKEKSGGVQGCKIADKNGRLVSFIGIYLTPQGYSVRPVWNEKKTEKLIAQERSFQEGMVVGTLAADEGLNGTALALYKTDTKEAK